MTVEMNQNEKTTEFPTGSLRLYTIAQDQLVVGQRIKGELRPADILKALGEFGIVHGRIIKNIDYLAAGSDGEVPVASAQFIQIPIQTRSNLFDAPLVQALLEAGSINGIDDTDVTYRVNAGDTLAEIENLPKAVMRNPDGRITVLKIFEYFDPKLICGENTALDDSGTKVIAQTDGHAHRSTFGTFAVYPADHVPAVGKIHARVAKECALTVDLDVDTESRIRLPSNLIIEGNILGAEIDVKGNIQLNLDTKIPADYENSVIRAGQTVRGRILSDSTIQAGEHIIALRELRNCQVECMDSVIAREIADSRILVGNCVVAENITGKNQVKIISNGDMLNLDPRQATLNDHMKRLQVIEEDLEENIFAWNKTKKNLSEIARRIQKYAYSKEQHEKARKALDQLYVNLGTTLSSYESLFGQFKQLSQQITKDSHELDQIKNLQERYTNPSVVVFGTISPGTRIKGPANEITIRESKSHLRFSLDPFTSLLIEQPLGD